MENVKNTTGRAGVWAAQELVSEGVPGCSPLGSAKPFQLAQGVRKALTEFSLRNGHLLKVVYRCPMDC